MWVSGAAGLGPASWNLTWAAATASGGDLCSRLRGDPPVPPSGQLCRCVTPPGTGTGPQHWAGWEVGWLECLPANPLHSARRHPEELVSATGEWPGPARSAPSRVMARPVGAASVAAEVLPVLVPWQHRPSPQAGPQSVGAAGGFAAGVTGSARSLQAASHTRQLPGGFGPLLSADHRVLHCLGGSAVPWRHPCLLF